MGIFRSGVADAGSSDAARNSSTRPDWCGYPADSSYPVRLIFCAEPAAERSAADVCRLAVSGEAGGQAPGGVRGQRRLCRPQDVQFQLAAPVALVACVMAVPQRQVRAL